MGAFEWKNDRQSAEAYLQELSPETAVFRATHLYPREQYARYSFGTVLLYRHDTWHRGTPLKPTLARAAGLGSSATNCLRVVMNMTFRKHSSEWISTLHSGWAWSMYRRNLQVERLVALASVEQRCVLGFPRPGHVFWTPLTIGAVKARYGPLGMDMTPYEQALSVI